LKFAVGDKLTVGTPANRQVVTIKAVKSDGPFAQLKIAPALTVAHITEEDVVEPGTGIELTAPLKFNHAANLPFSARGTGISFAPATAFAHSSNEPVVPLGTGITLDQPLAKDHAIDAVVRDAAVTSAGYQGEVAPHQWFGGPALSVNAGSMVLRNAAGLVVDSLNYGNFANNGNLVDPWAAEGYQAVSGLDKSGCFVTTPGAPISFPPVNAIVANSSAGRYPDGRDSDSNCADFRSAAATVLPEGAKPGATALKVARVADFHAGQTVLIGAGASRETAVIVTVGTPGATTAREALVAGATELPVVNGHTFAAGQTITIDDGANAETAVVQEAGFGRNGMRIVVTAPLKSAHGIGVPVSGSGLILSKPLAQSHPNGTQVTTDIPTPGAPNQYGVSAAGK